MKRICLVLLALFSLLAFTAGVSAVPGCDDGATATLAAVCGHDTTANDTTTPVPPATLPPDGWLLPDPVMLKARPAVPDDLMRSAAVWLYAIPEHRQPRPG